MLSSLSERKWSLVTGLIGGLFSGLTGVGGGAVMVPLLTGLLRLPQHLAHGTSLTIVIFIASAGLVGYWMTANVDWTTALGISVGSVVGAYLGARTMVRVPARALRMIFGLFLFAVAIRMFLQ